MFQYEAFHFSLDPNKSAAWTAEKVSRLKKYICRQKRPPESFIQPVVVNE